MSPLPPIADIRQRIQHVRFVLSGLLGSNLGLANSQHEVPTLSALAGIYERDQFKVAC